MTWDKERGFDLLRSKRERDQMLLATALLPPSFSGEHTQEQRDQLMALAGAWRGNWIARARERAFDLFRTRDERQASLPPRLFLEGELRKIRGLEKKALDRLDAIYSQHAQQVVDFSGAAAKIRGSQGLPATGSVRGLPGVPEEVAEAIETLESHGGLIPVSEGLKILARLDPQGNEAAVLARRNERTS